MFVHFFPSAHGKWMEQESEKQFRSYVSAEHSGVMVGSMACTTKQGHWKQLSPTGSTTHTQLYVLWGRKRTRLRWVLVFEYAYASQSQVRMCFARLSCFCQSFLPFLFNALRPGSRHYDYFGFLPVCLWHCWTFPCVQWCLLPSRLYGNI